MDKKLIDQMKSFLNKDEMDVMKSVFDNVQPKSLTNKNWTASRVYQDMELSKFDMIDNQSDYFNMSLVFKDEYEENSNLPSCILRLPFPVPFSYSDVEIKGSWKKQASTVLKDPIKNYEDVFIFQEHLNQSTPAFAWVIMKLSEDKLVLGLNRTADLYSDIIGFSVK